MHSTDAPPLTEHAKLNRFAIRCFRDTGDTDYIAARLAMRARLGEPFLWSGQQAVEKYLKCILMLNRHATGKLGHNLRLALNRVDELLPFEINLSDDEEAIFKHLDNWSADRYLLNSYVLRERHVLQLDKLVWKLRQYCRPLDVRHYADPPCPTVLLENACRVKAGMSGSPKDGYLQGGKLERILENKQHPARSAIVWKNQYYGSRNRKNILVSTGAHAENSPLWLYPELVDEAANWMKIDHKYKAAAKALIMKRKCSTKT